MGLRKTRKNIICWVIIFIEFIFIEFPYLFLVGPIGIFGDSEIMIKAINTYGRIIKMVPIDNSMLIETFAQRVGNCDVPCAQLARIYADNWGVVLPVSIPILTNTYINNKIKEVNTIVKMSRLLAVLTLYIMTALVFLSVIPFVSALKLSRLYDGGSALEIFKYIGLWIFPSVLVLTGLTILLALVIREPFGQIMVYGFLIAPSLTPKVSHYPFYKLVIRFNGKTEAFYYELRREILFNRIWIIIVTMLMFAALFLVLKRRRKVI